MVSITQINLNWGSYYDSHDVGSNGTVTIITSNVTDGTTVNVGLNSIIYTGTVNNNSAFVNIPSTAFNILTSKVEYVVTGSINNIAQAFATFVYDPTKDPFVLNPNSPTVTWPNNITNNGTVTVTLGSGASTWEYSLDYGNNWNTGTNNYFVLIDGTYPITSIHVRNSSSSEVVSTSKINEYEIIISSTPPNPPTVTWPNSPSNDGIVNITLDISASTWQYSLNNGVNWNDGSGTTFTLSEGLFNANFLQVRNIDIAGNISSIVTNPSNIIVDKTDPGIPTVIWPNTFSADGTVNITLGNDAVSWEYSLNNGIDWNDGIGSSFILSEGSYSKYILQVRNSDSAGNISSVVFNDYDITIDNTPPNPPTVLWPSITNTGIIDVTIDVSAVTWEYSITSGSNWITGNGNSFTLSETTHLTNSIQVRNYNSLGVVSSAISNPDQIIVDRTIPSVPTVSWPNILSNNDIVNITLGNDATSWEYSLNNGVNWNDGIGTSFILPEGTYLKHTLQVRNSDDASNVSFTVVNLDNITIDKTIPIITISGESIVQHEKGTIYVDVGATAIDFSGIDLTENIIVNNEVNFNAVGSYSVSYNVSDDASNQAIQVTRTVNVVDTTIPIITISGESIVQHEKGTIYVDSGAVASDLSGIDLTTSIVRVNNVDINTVGSYTVTYDVSDNVGNEAIQVTRTVNVVDTTIPIITISGESIVQHEKGTVYVDAGASATDLSGILLTNFIVTENNVDINTVGNYSVTYDVSDNVGNQAIQVTRTVNIVDTTAPIITLIGDASLNHEKGTVYIDAGATCTDLSNIDLTSSIITVNNVDINTIGNYSVTYDVSDNVGNQAIQVTRTVNVVDTTAPVITISGESIVQHEKDTIYVDAGASAIDLSGIDLTNFIVTVNNVDINIVGTYTITYDVSDNVGNQAIQVIRTVNVVDTTIPIITISGESIIQHEKGTIYVDAGSVATDLSGIDLTNFIVTVNNVDINTIGSYSVTYDVSDNAGNQAIQVIRTVNVVDTTAPVISLSGESIIQHEKGTIYVDAGSAATDLSGIDLTTSIVTVNNVDINTIGSYSVTYDVSDNVGNQASQVTRTVNVVDTTIPIITISGESIIQHEKGTVYIDAGSTATDLSNIDLTSNIITSSNLNSNIIGTYTITYDVSDNVGNQAIQVTRTVNVVDTTLPVITISGESIVQHEKDTIYVDAGATATDLSNIDLTSNIIISSNLNTNVIGTYTITYDVSDNVGNFAIQKTRTVNVDDTTLPVITISGESIVQHEKGTIYVDAGATAIDFSGIDLTSNIIVTSNLNTNVIGTYTITYDVSDNANNFAIQKSRTVNVFDTTVPVISVDGSAIVIHEKGTIFNDPGVSATDLSGDDLTANIITSSNLNTNVVGTYTITYDVSDNANNFAIQKSRTVNVVDTTAPIITLIGNNNINHERGIPYNDLGAIATDLSGIDLTSNIIVNNGVFYNIVDMYQVTYDVSDNFGNQASRVIRNVNVIDTTAPIISLNGNAIVTHEKGTVYNDLGAIATDLSNIDLTSIIVTNNNVDQDNVGTYSVTYNVSDNSGNQASQVTRTVNVIDTTSPVITLIGNSTVIHEMNAIYNDLGATAVDSPGIDLTSNIVVNNEVNINVEGSYNVYYDVSDNSGNQAIQVIRTVNVVDTTIPIIVLIGNSVINHERGTIYNDLGAVASDISSNDLTSNIIVNNGVNFNIVGSYTVTYDVSDNAGNNAIQVIRTVNIIDTTAPVISLIGDASLNHEKGTTYTDAGASAIDLSNIDLTSSIITVNNVDINTVGSYTVTYDVSDNSGNQAIQVTRIVNIVDTTSPNSPFVIWPNSPANDGTVDVSMIDDAVRWEYSLNSGIDWNDGSGTSFILVEGIYDVSSLQVRSSDDASNISQIIVSPNQIIIDLTVPSPPVIIWPTDLSNNNNVTVTIDASASTWEYSIDNGVTWNNGTDSSFNLLDGTYGIGVIQVRNTDSANNISAISSNPSEIVISTIVNEPIVNWPNNPSRDGKVIITLGSGATTWEYSIDNSANWNDGSNNYFTLVDGSYGIGILQVRNSNSFGNVSNTVTNPYEIIVDSVVSAPFVTWPSSPSDDGIVTVLMSNDAVTWEYRLNSSSEWIDGCGNTFVLPEGTYQECIIQVRNSDVSGNISAITINPTEIIVDYTPATDSSNNVEFTLSAMNGSLDTSQFNTDDLDIEDMTKYVHVINVDMSLNKWNDLFFISPQGPAYLDNLSTLSSMDLFLNETIKFMTKSSNFTDAINDISINNLILDTGTLTADTKLYNITESSIKIWSKNIFGGIEYMDDIWSNRSIVVFEINDFLSNVDSSNSLVGKLKTTIDNANGKTNQNKTKINLTRQLMLQLHNSIYGRESFYRLTNTNGGIFSQTPVDISGNTWITGAGDKYYPFKFISGDKLNFGLTIKHPDVYIPILGNSFDSQSPPNINIKVRVNMK